MSPRSGLARGVGRGRYSSGGWVARSWVIGATGKLLWIWHELYAEGRLRATEEILGVHVDTAAGRATPFPDDVAARIAERRVAPPEHASRQILVR